MPTSLTMPPAKPAFHAARFEDPTLQSEAILGWGLRYVQMSSGRFAGASHQVHLPGFHLLRESNSTWLNQFGQPCPGRVVIGCRLRAQAEVTVNGRHLPAQSVGILDGDAEVNVLHPPMEVAVVAVDRALLNDCLAPDLPAPLRGGTGRPMISVIDSRYAPHFGLRLVDMLSTLSRLEDTVAGAAVVNAMQEDLLSLVTPLLEIAVPPERAKLSAFSRAELVRRARRHLLDHIDQPLQVGQLCQAMRVSRRAMQSAFQEELGTTPAAYLRLLRLNGARRDLLAADAGTSVSAVITRWGFWHFSRFSAEYRRMYGELPSATLAKRRPRPGARVTAPQTQALH